MSQLFLMIIKCVQNTYFILSFPKDHLGLGFNEFHFFGMVTVMDFIPKKSKTNNSTSLTYLLYHYILNCKNFIEDLRIRR